MVSQTVLWWYSVIYSDCINFKTFAFLAVYWPFWTSLNNTDIKVKKKKIKLILHNVKQCLLPVNMYTCIGFFFNQAWKVAPNNKTLIFNFFPCVMYQWTQQKCISNRSPMCISSINFNPSTVEWDTVQYIGLL